MAVGDAYVSWLSHTSTNTTFFFESHQLLFSHASAEVGKDFKLRLWVLNLNRSNNNADSAGHQLSDLLSPYRVLPRPLWRSGPLRLKKI